jgi:homoserine dehydrogenase
LGYRVRLIGRAHRGPDGLELSVSPTLVPEDSPLARVEGAFNAVQIVGDAVGPLFLHGLGAGQNPTASAVVADVIDTIAGRAAITFGALKLWSDDRDEEIALSDPGDTAGRFYLRLTVERRTDTVAEVARLLTQHETPVESLVQYEDDEDEQVAGLVVMTGQTTEGRFAAAVAEIEKLPAVRPGAVRCRVAE